MVVNNPNNWHWVDKNCIDWSKTYFNEHLVGLHAGSDGRDVKVSSVSSLEGDVEVCQRKGKVISIYDLRIIMNVEGQCTSDKSFKGSITVPELAYDTEEDELQFDISIYNEDSDNDAMRPVIRKELVPKIRAALMQFGTDLIQTHGSDIQHESAQVNSKFTKENQEAIKKQEKAQAEAQAAAQKAKAQPAPQAQPKTSSNVPKYNTSTLHLEPTFNATADRLYMALLDRGMVSAWTRSNVEIEAREGTDYQLFGGAVSGKIVKLVQDERIVQTWRLDSWKTGHYAELDIQLKQGAGETTMVVKFSGIPIGEEDRVRGNFQDMYVRSMKVTFGFGAVL